MLLVSILSKRFVPTIMALGLLFTSSSFQAQAQEVSREATTTGIVVTVHKNSITVKTPEGSYRVFQIDKNTTKPVNIAVGAQVKVTWSPTDDPAIRLADDILVIPPGQTAETAQQSSVPASVRHVESGIEEQFRRYRVGFQGGFGLDPEVADIGLHAQIGPFFTPDLFFRPSFDFAFGELTTLWALNGEVIYRAPFGSMSRRWFYFGGGPGFNFAEKSFGASNINFSDFNYDATLNLLAGMQWRTGLYTELKTRVFAKQAPVIQFLVGYTF